MTTRSSSSSELGYMLNHPHAGFLQKLFGAGELRLALQ